MTQRDLEGSETDPKPAGTEGACVQEMASLSPSMGLGVDAADGEAPVEEHREQLSTEEHQGQQKQQPQEVTEEISSGQEAIRDDAPSTLVKDMSAKWAGVHSSVEHYYPAEL